MVWKMVQIISRSSSWMWRRVIGRLDQSSSDAASYVITTETTQLTRKIKPPFLATRLQKEYKMVDKNSRSLPRYGTWWRSVQFLAPVALSPGNHRTDGCVGRRTSKWENKTHCQFRTEFRPSSGHSLPIMNYRCWEQPTPNCVRLTPWPSADDKRNNTLQSAL
jgi:hypothetical protein